LVGAPAADPNNPHFVYQRFQNGILLYDSTAGTTQALPMGEYLKAILTGQNLPADLSSEAASSPLLRAAGLTTTADLTGVDPKAVLRYERENADREDVVAALEGLVEKDAEDIVGVISA